MRARPFGGLRPLALGLLLLGLGAEASAEEGARRIISLAPALTETLFALGAGPQVVGVTDFCGYPPEAKTRPKVGGFYDLRLEAILRLRPDLILALPEHHEQQAKLQALKLPWVTVEMHSLAGIYSGFIQLGQLTHHEAEAARLAGQFRQALLQAKRATAALRPKRVLLVVSREYGAGRIQEVYVAGPHEFYAELLALAGATNAYAESPLSFPKLSLEGLLQLDPELVIELVPELDRTGRTRAQLLNDWKELDRLQPGFSQRVRILAGDHTAVPGPRLTWLVKELVQTVHPEAILP